MTEKPEYISLDVKHVTHWAGLFLATGALFEQNW